MFNKIRSSKYGICIWQNNVSLIIRTFSALTENTQGPATSDTHQRGQFTLNLIQKFTAGRRKSTYFITTPIFYVNSDPHVGHLYSACLADARHRWELLKGGKSVLTTGTDEHGLKVQKAAQQTGQQTSDFCDEISAKFRTVFDKFDISYTDYIRTTEQRHKDTVYKFWEKLMKQGCIYKGHYEGWYSVPDETYLTSLQVEDKSLPNGDVIKMSKDSGHQVEWNKEENYMFRLSEFRDKLKKWLSKDDVIQPAVFRPLVEKWLDDLQDLSVSREASRLKWGIPVPGDQSQTIYVWLDALVNYLTVAGDQSKSIWPPDCHVVGKDILKFHAVYWPAFLLAADLPLPRMIFCHSHWTVDNVKMSKSLGNVVNPIQRLSKYDGSDGLRYFLLKEGVAHNDGNYSDVKVIKLINSDLCNTLGNLLGRCTALKIQPQQIFPGKGALTEEERDWMVDLYRLSDKVDKEFSSLAFYRGLDEILSRLHETNALLQHREVWKLKNKQLETLLYLSMENLRVCSILLQPVVPNVSRKILDRLNVPVNRRGFVDCLEEPRFELPRKLGEDKGLLYARLR